MLLGMTRRITESRFATFLAVAGVVVAVLDVVAAVRWPWHGPPDVAVVLLLLAGAGVEAVCAAVSAVIASTMKMRPPGAGARALLWVGFALILVVEIVGVLVALAALT